MKLAKIVNKLILFKNEAAFPQRNSIEVIQKDDVQLWFSLDVNTSWS